MVDIAGAMKEAWRAYGDPREVVGWEETSPGVSTNRVLRLDLSDGTRVFGKHSSYGSFVHFRQDQSRVLQWHTGLAGTPFANLLALPLCRDGRVFTHRGDHGAVVFYAEAPRKETLPKVLHHREIDSIGEEMAALHAATAAMQPALPRAWKSVGSDLAELFDWVGGTHGDHDEPSAHWSPADRSMILAQCERFFAEADRLGYHSMTPVGVLVDWNRGNFSVEHNDQGMVRLFSRWDYDWFRVEPRVFDFYFLARLAREEGDKTAFSYSPEPLFEERFIRMLRAYHEVAPLQREEVLFLREAYRFFLLNYVISKGMHFFVPHLYERLCREALDKYLPAVDGLDFERLADAVL